MSSQMKSYQLWGPEKSQVEELCLVALGIATFPALEFIHQLQRLSKSHERISVDLKSWHQFLFLKSEVEFNGLIL